MRLTLARDSYVLPIIVFVLGTLASVYLGLKVHGDILVDARSDFKHMSERTTADIQRRFARVKDGLQGASGLYAASKSVERGEFKAYMNTLNMREAYPGVRGFGFIERVQRSELDKFVAAERDDDAPRFTVRLLADQSHNDLYVIKLIEPLSANGAAIGLDVGSEAVRRQAIETAIDLNQVTISAVITLVQANGKTPGALLYFPVYRLGMPLTTVEERRQALRGVLYSPIVYEEFLRDLSYVVAGKLDFELTDAPFQGKPGALMFDADNHLAVTGGVLSDEAQQRRFSSRVTLPLFGRDVSVDLHSTPRFDANIDLVKPWLLGGGGVLLSALLALLMRQQVSGRHRAERLARTMTADLDRMAQVAKHTSNAVSIADADGKIMWVNEGFHRLTGFDSAEALGKTREALIGGNQWAQSEFGDAARSGAIVEPTRAEMYCLSKHGNALWLDTEIQPRYDAHAKFLGFMEISTDITERMRIQDSLQAAIRSSESLLSALDLHAIVSVTDGAGTITEVNDNFCAVSGYTREELIGANHRIVNSGEQSAAFWVDMWKTISSGMPWRGQVCNRAKDGHLYWVETFIAPFIGNDGQIEKYVSIRIDISANKKAEADLRWNQSLMEMMSNSSPLGFLVVDNRTDEILYFNERFCKIWGIEHLAGAMQRHELKNNDIIADCLPVLVDVAAFAESCKPLQHEDNRVTLEDEIAFTHDRTVRRFTTQIRDVDDRYYGRFYIFEDITERRHTEALAKRSGDLLRGSIEALDDAFSLFDPQDKLILCNQAYRNLYPKCADVLVEGHTFEEIIRTGAQRGQFADATGSPQELEDWVRNRLARHLLPFSQLQQKTSDGRTLQITERRMPDGHTVGYRADVTALAKATEAAQAASRSKSDFLANMSHEIRTPMNAILGMLTLLRKTELTPRQADYAAKSDGAARALLGLLNEILDFSKIEAGKMALDPHPFGIDKLLRDLSVILSANVGAKPVEVLFDIDPQVPRHLVGDAMRLQQVLINLAGNAIKFTQQGEVVVAIQVLQRSDVAATLQFSVRDTGIGIAPENQARIFSGFTQAESSTSRRFGGTGLGVAISQRFVTMMGGELELQSALGEGSRFFFTVTLPVSADTEDQPPPRALVDDQGRPWHVLVVDDNPTACEVVQHMGQSLGWTVDVAVSGTEALTLLQQQIVQGTGYNAVFMDWNMPGMDGWEATQRVRALDMQGHMPIVVMVTAHGREMLSQRSQEEQSLLDGFLVKPITASMLFDAVVDAQRDKGLPHPSYVTVAAGEPRLQNMRVLLAEDNINNQQVACELLEGEGAIVQLANDGQQAIDAVKSAETPFDVVLMDLQMPVMDGYAATHVLRSELQLTQLPIVAMTANAMASDRDACIAAGMNDHVGKPFDLNHLVQVLRKQAGWADADMAVSKEPAKLSASVMQAAEAAGVEIEAAMRRLGDKQQVYLNMLRSFVRDLDSFSGLLQDHAKRGEMEPVKRMLHTIKGLAATLGATALSAHAAKGEKQMVVGLAQHEMEEVAQQACNVVAAARPGLEGLLPLLELDAQGGGLTPALDKAALRAYLNTMAEQLEADDMEALNTMAELQLQFGLELGAAMDDLSAAMADMDLAAALPLCRALQAQYAD